jgi:hypothetical protein
MNAGQMLGGTLPRGAVVTRIWKLADGADVATIDHAAMETVVALSRDGTTAAIVTSLLNRDDLESLSKGLRVAFPLKVALTFWDVARGRAAVAPIQSDGFIGTAAFSEDGATLVTTSVPVVWATPGPLAVGGGSFAVWDVRSGRRIAAPHLAVPTSLADAAPHGPPFGQDPFLAAYGVSQDRRALVVTEQLAGDGGPTRIRTRRLDWQTADLARMICERLPAGERALTPEEIRRLIPGERYQPTCPP